VDEGKVTVIPHHDPNAWAAAVQSVESRSVPRYRVLQRSHVRPPGVTAEDAWRGIVFSISAGGIGVTLPLPVERNVELDIEPWNLPGARPVRARIVHTTRLENIWLVGCELSCRLSKDELDAWLATAPTGP
jgi:hypothetical protein